MLAEVDPGVAATAGKAAGDFLNGLAGSGIIGAFVAVGLAVLIVMEAFKLQRDRTHKPAGDSVTVDAEAIDRAAERVGRASAAHDAECQTLSSRVNTLEMWRVEHSHKHELAEAVEATRREVEREHTNPGRRR